MRTPHDLPAAGSLLRWCGLLFVVLAIVGGILGMHGLNGAPGASMGHGGPGSTAHTIGGMAIQPALPSVHAAQAPCPCTEPAYRHPPPRCQMCRCREFSPRTPPERGTPWCRATSPRIAVLTRHR